MRVLYRVSHHDQTQLKDWSQNPRMVEMKKIVQIRIITKNGDLPNLEQFGRIETSELQKHKQLKDETPPSFYNVEGYRVVAEDRRFKNHHRSTGAFSFQKVQPEHLDTRRQNKFAFGRSICMESEKKHRFS
jgi:hypothetical protein